MVLLSPVLYCAALESYRDHTWPNGGELSGPDSSESLYHLPSLPTHPPGALSPFSAASLTH